MTTSTVKRLRVPGISLRFTMVLFTAIIVWFALRADRKFKETKIAELKAILGETIVKDFEAYGIKSIQDVLFDPRPNSGKVNRTCEVYLPRGGSYEICFAGTGIGPTGFPTPEERLSIESGYRKIELHAERADDHWKFKAEVDDRTFMSRTFDGGILSASLFAGYRHHGETRQQSTDQPLELIRNMLGPITPKTPTGKALALGDGIMIWIERKWPALPQP